MSDQQFSLFATTAKGLEDLLTIELNAMGFADIKPANSGVHFTANASGAMKACLWSRIANRVLLKIDQFSAPDEDQLYQNMMAIDWQTHFAVNDSFAISCALRRSNLNHSQYVALKAKDAIVDQFRQRTSDRPDVNTDNPDVLLNLYIHNNEAIIYHDLSGQSLHKRGYRIEGEHAPLKENLAAAILMRANWPDKSKQQYAFVDPMCGSGTLVIEAALMAADIAPGLNREQFGFQQWRHYDEQQWHQLLEQARQRKQDGLTNTPLMTGYDFSPYAVSASQINAEKAGIDNIVHFERRDISLASPRSETKKGIIVVNPPYGLRISTKPEVFELYEQMGQRFIDAFPQWYASVFTDSLELAKKIPLRAKKIHSLYNGAIECKLLHFEIKPEKIFDTKRKFKTISKENRSENAKSFENRLKKNKKHLTRWTKREDVSCYRIYDADIPEYALAVDLYYADKLNIVVQEYEAPKTIDAKQAILRLNEALNCIVEYFEISQDQLEIKQRKQQKGSQQYEKHSNDDNFHIVNENNFKFRVNFSDYLDTGLFLDHRITRKLVGELAKDKDFLNLFCYTGAASIYAAKGGASATTSVDMSNTYINWAQQNFELNELYDTNHQFIRDDCLTWLSEQTKKYELIFLDPPSFSNSKKMANRFAIQQDHVGLLKQALNLLTDDGILIFSNNFRNFKLDQSEFDNCNIENISASTLSEDFKRNPKIHNCWKITKK